MRLFVETKVPMQWGSRGKQAGKKGGIYKEGLEEC